MPEDKNLFIIEEIFPSPKESFLFNLKPLEEIENTSLVVFDANALLALYLTGKRGKQELRRILSNLIKEERFYIPIQVAREFLKHRTDKIQDVYSEIDKIKTDQSIFDIGKYPLLEDFQEYKDLKDSERKIKEEISKLRENLKKLKLKFKAMSWNDSITSMFNDIFLKETFVDTSTSKEELQKDLERRILYKIPPGYKDSSKDDMGIGDVIIWHTLLNLAQKKKNDLIFVTDDTKLDWWVRKKDYGKKTMFFPRIELIEEFRRCTSGMSFYMMTLPEFLFFSKVEKDLVNRISRDLRTEARVSLFLKEQLIKMNDNFSYLEHIIVSLMDILVINIESDSVYENAVKLHNYINSKYGIKLFSFKLLSKLKLIEDITHMMEDSIVETFNTPVIKKFNQLLNDGIIRLKEIDIERIVSRS